MKLTIGVMGASGGEFTEEVRQKACRREKRQRSRTLSLSPVAAPACRMKQFAAQRRKAVLLLAYRRASQ